MNFSSSTMRTRGRSSGAAEGDEDMSAEEYGKISDSTCEPRFACHEEPAAWRLCGKKSLHQPHEDRFAHPCVRGRRRGSVAGEHRSRPQSVRTRLPRVAGDAQCGIGPFERGHRSLPGRRDGRGHSGDRPARRLGTRPPPGAPAPPSPGRANSGTLLALALASALGEEILFRGLLVPLLGVVLSALVFGALHQVRGPGRWAWMGWATVMGLLFGLVLAATGSLVGPIAAHAIINAANLRFLRDNDPEATPKPLGGLLRRT